MLTTTKTPTTTATKEMPVIMIKTTAVTNCDTNKDDVVYNNDNDGDYFNYKYNNNNHKSDNNRIINHLDSNHSNFN